MAFNKISLLAGLTFSLSFNTMSVSAQSASDEARKQSINAIVALSAPFANTAVVKIKQRLMSKHLSQHEATISNLKKINNNIKKLEQTIANAKSDEKSNPGNKTTDSALISQAEDDLEQERTKLANTTQSLEQWVQEDTDTQFNRLLNQFVDQEEGVVQEAEQTISNSENAASAVTTTETDSSAVRAADEGLSSEETTSVDDALEAGEEGAEAGLAGGVVGAIATSAVGFGLAMLIPSPNPYAVIDSELNNIEQSINGIINGVNQLERKVSEIEQNLEIDTLLILNQLEADSIQQVLNKIDYLWNDYKLYLTTANQNTVDLEKLSNKIIAELSDAITSIDNALISPSPIAGTDILTQTAFKFIPELTESSAVLGTYNAIIDDTDYYENLLSVLVFYNYYRQKASLLLIEAHHHQALSAAVNGKNSDMCQNDSTNPHGNPYYHCVRANNAIYQYYYGGYSNASSKGGIVNQMFTLGTSLTDSSDYLAVYQPAPENAPINTPGNGTLWYRSISNSKPSVSNVQFDATGPTLSFTWNFAPPPQIALPYGFTNWDLAALSDWNVLFNNNSAAGQSLASYLTKAPFKFNLPDALPHSNTFITTKFEPPTSASELNPYTNNGDSNVWGMNFLFYSPLTIPKTLSFDRSANNVKTIQPLFECVDSDQNPTDYISFPYNNATFNTDSMNLSISPGSANCPSGSSHIADFIFGVGLGGGGEVGPPDVVSTSDQLGSITPGLWPIINANSCSENALNPAGWLKPCNTQWISSAFANHTATVLQTTKNASSCLTNSVKTTAKVTTCEISDPVFLPTQWQLEQSLINANMKNWSFGLYTPNFNQNGNILDVIWLYQNTTIPGYFDNEQAPQWPSAPNGQFISGDFNGDGNWDIAIADLQAGNKQKSFPVQIQYAATTGVGFTSVASPPTGFFSEFIWETTILYLMGNPKIVSGDWNGDGFYDLALINALEGIPGGQVHMFVVINNGKGSIGQFSQTQTFNLAPIQETGVVDYANTDVFSGDFNGDGLTDIAYRDTTTETSNISIYLTKYNSANGVMSFTQASTLSWFSGGDIAAGDFNDDGIADIAIRNPNKLNNLYIAYGFYDKKAQLYSFLNTSETNATPAMTIQPNIYSAGQFFTGKFWPNLNVSNW